MSTNTYLLCEFAGAKSTTAKKKATTKKPTTPKKKATTKSYCQLCNSASVKTTMEGYGECNNCHNLVDLS